MKDHLSKQHLVTVEQTVSVNSPLKLLVEMHLLQEEIQHEDALEVT